MLTMLQGLPQLSRGEIEMYNERIVNHYNAGTWYGQASSGILYALAAMLECVDNDILW